MTLREACDAGIQILKEQGIEEAQMDAFYLLEYVTGISRTSYYADPTKALSEVQQECYLTYIKKRAKRVPLQHITGEQEFMGYRFQVNEHVLIPRQDTECLVEEAEQYLREGMRILDMCTGSGCILISLLKRAAERSGISGVTGIGVDISDEALQVAAGNAKQLDCIAEFQKSDLFTAVTGTYDMILSNPPYIRTEVIKSLADEVKLYDPMLALDGKADGLFFYREIVRQSPAYLKPGGRLFLEIGYDQAEAVELLLDQQGFEQIVVKKDLAGLDRIMTGVYNRAEK